MPKLAATNKFIEDLEAFRRDPALPKKIAKALAFFESDPLHPGLHLERIVNDPSAWSIRVDRAYRISMDPGGFLTAGNPDWSQPVTLLRILSHDDLYRVFR